MTTARRAKYFLLMERFAEVGKRLPALGEIDYDDPEAVADLDALLGEMDTINDELEAIVLAEQGKLN